MGVLLALVPSEFGISFGITVVVVLITSNPTLGLSIGLAFLPLFIWLSGGSSTLIIYPNSTCSFSWRQVSISWAQKSRRRR